MSSDQVEILKRALARERSARKQAEDILEKKSAELFDLNLENKKSKEKLESLLKVKNSELKGFYINIVDPYIMMDLSGNAIKMNQAAEDLLGYRLDEETLNLMKITQPEEYEHIANSFKILHTTGRITDFRTKLITKNKTLKLVHVNASVIYDEHNNPIAAQGILRDITKQNAAEQELIESRNRLTTLILSLDSSVILEDEHDDVMLTNQNFCDLFEINCPPESLKGKSYIDILKESNFAAKVEGDFVLRTQEILNNKETVIGEEIKLKDGKVLKRDYIPIFKGENYKGHLWSFKDISLRKRYQKSLEAEKQKYSNIIANMNLGLIELNKKGEVIFANQGFVDMSGYAKEELLGSLVGELILSKSSKDKMTEATDKREKGVSDSYEIEIKNKEGEKRYWLVSGAPNYNLNGEYTGSIGINFDITDIKKLEKQKEQLLVELAKSNEGLQEYAHVVSHDLKSPLRSIDALVSWIKEDNAGKLDEMTLQNFQMIEKTLEVMESLISDVLLYSSVGADFEKKGNVSTNDMVYQLLEVMYIPENIKITCKQELPIVTGDKIKLQQLFQNLLSNAIKFSDKEKGTVEVSCRETDTDYEFAVSDNGIGIDKVYFDKIFQTFHSLNKRKDSSGLGLSIVKKIVELHNGKIWLESELGKGTTFYFTIKKDI